MAYKMKGFSGHGNESPLKQDAIKIMKKSILSPEDLKASKDTIVSARDASTQYFNGYGWEKRDSEDRIIRNNPNIQRDNFSVYKSQNNRSNFIGHGMKEKMGGFEEGYDELQSAGSRSSTRIKKHYKQKDLKPMSKEDAAKVDKDLAKAMYKPLPKSK